MVFVETVKLKRAQNKQKNFDDGPDVIIKLVQIERYE